MHRLVVQQENMPSFPYLNPLDVTEKKKPYALQYISEI